MLKSVSFIYLRGPRHYLSTAFIAPFPVAKFDSLYHIPNLPVHINSYTTLNYSNSTIPHMSQKSYSGVPDQLHSAVHSLHSMYADELGTK